MKNILTIILVLFALIVNAQLDTTQRIYKTGEIAGTTFIGGFGLPKAGAYNTLIGFLAGKNITTGSYNFIVGNDSLAQNISANSSYMWYIQPDADAFNNNLYCLQCLLLVYPYVYKELPNDEILALEIIKKGRECLHKYPPSLVSINREFLIKIIK